ncbi:hypothetical protein DNK47_00365 [Mycoplasma wenyonii]|uniref:Restriction endonuclease type II NgoFVII N-terminal domain-containing protein n=1 Tax=Mycoplasma wenyonii TaxID=65123 RepID=A0A328PV47_9MOLU|nr:restriction endonuclease PLD domain-containing protein [Mycoplasma wenyonii]RAO95301.1 hypothetical protein DNK47_00365 [Mycoplasma wenyonii]
MQDDELLCSSIWPLLTEENDKTIKDCFKEEIKKSDQLEIAVGFASCKSLLELDKLITQQNIKNVSLILGMYFLNGFPEELLQLVMEINEKWQKQGIGEIRVVFAFKNHVKLYCFLKNGEVRSAIIGSPNLSFLTDQETIWPKWRQYEMAYLTHNPKILKKTKKHIDSLKSEDVSNNIAYLVKNQLLIVKKVNKTEPEKFFKISGKNTFKK